MLALADLAINSIVCLPVTGVGWVTLPEIQKIYNSNPAGIPIPPLVPVRTINTLDPKTTGLVGDMSYYNKKIGTTKLTDYPSYFKSTALYFQDAAKDSVLNMPYLFLKTSLKGSNDAKITVNKFSPTSIRLFVAAKSEDSLVFLQNNYPYWRAFINKREVPVSTAFRTFMSVPIQQGNNEVEFVYDDKYLLYFSIIGMVALLGITVLSFKPNSLEHI
jgi:hypothetical protein